MLRVVPSQVVAMVDQLFPFAATQTQEQRKTVGQSHSAELSALVRLIEQVPADLLMLDAPDYAVFVIAVEAIRDTLATWRSGASMGPGEWVLAEVQGLPQLSPVTLIRRLLAKCPDQAPAPGTTTLSFITDAALRDSIRLDISSANQDLVQGEWKGATILAGSATEALLLWTIQQHEQQNPGARAASIAALLDNKTLTVKAEVSCPENAEVRCPLFTDLRVPWCIIMPRRPPPRRQRGRRRVGVCGRAGRPFSSRGADSSRP